MSGQNEQTWKGGTPRTSTDIKQVIREIAEAQGWEEYFQECSFICYDCSQVFGASSYQEAVCPKCGTKLFSEEVIYSQSHVLPPGSTIKDALLTINIEKPIKEK